LTFRRSISRWSHEITEGKKEDGTDIHNVNKSALGPICRTRDDAKTFIYAWLLGAGIPKIASILNCSQVQAKEAVQNFLDSLPELKQLKRIRIPHDARMGYFTGLDGRRVRCSSEHLMLSGYLQEGESTIMKHANVLWRKEADRLQVPYKQIDFVHDEWVVECGTQEDAERIGKIQEQAIEQTGKDLGLFCPLSGTSHIGKTWAEVH
jgi:DNA polymerase I-like protein with 3'-5' exonuclease and polymerase domains